MHSRRDGIEDVQRALAEQDARLRAAYEELDPNAVLRVPVANLEQLAERCSLTSVPERGRRAVAADAIRC